MLTLGWSDGSTFFPVNSVLLSSENKRNRINEAAAMDKRTVGYKRRRLSMQKGTSISYCKVRPILSISSVWRVFKYLNRLSTPLWIITKIYYVVQLAVTHMIVKKLTKRKSRKLLVIFSQMGLLRMKKQQQVFLGFYFQKRKRRWEASILLVAITIIGNFWSESFFVISKLEYLR